MTIHGILETAIDVVDPAASAAFYRRLFGFDTLLDSERLVALDVAGRDVLLLFRKGGTAEPLETPGGVVPPHAGSGTAHFALAIAAADFDLWQRRLETQRIPIESTVHWPEGAHSLFFRDPDGHLLELVTPGLWTKARAAADHDSEPGQELP